MNNEPEKIGKLIGYFNKATGLLDSLILVSVAIGTIGLAIVMVIDLAMDFIYKEEHSIPHYVSEFMFILIIVELFRQVIRLINREPLSLNPFIFIGVISSIRGVIIMQMKMAIGEVEVRDGMITILANGFLILILFVCYYLYAKINNAVSDK